MMTRISAFCLCLVVLIATRALPAADAPNPHWPQKWNYIHVPFETDKDVDHLIDLLKQSREAGCTHIALGVAGMGRVDKLTDPAYIKMAEKIRATADELHLQIVPMIFSIGYGGETLRNDGNLMAGLPVKEMPFTIKGKTAEPDASGVATIKNGGFEEAPDGKLADWEGQAASMTIDASVKHGGAASLKIAMAGPTTAPAGGGGRGGRGGRGGPAPLSQKISVKPFQYYKLSVWVKAENFRVSSEMLAVTGNNRPQKLTQWQIPTSDEQKAAKDWVQISTYFDTLDSSEITIQIAARAARPGRGARGGGGGAGGGAGTLWIDDIELQPAGLMLALHRDTVPLVVTSDDGKTIYVEGKDYKPVIDSAIADFPKVGELDITHAAPKLELTDGSSIKDGQKVLVSFYNATRINTDQDVVTMQDPRVLTYWDQSMKELVKVWPAKGYFMACYDEIRISGWEPNPNGEKLTPGQILSRHTVAAYNIIKKYAPDATVYDWQDMYTPLHNAKAGVYYLCNGSFENSIDGIPTDIVMFNWNLARGQGAQSVSFFADKGFHQIFCGYYDATNLDGVKQNLRPWMEDSASAKNIDGIMYTTWHNNYDFLKDFFQLVDAYPAWVAGMPLPRVRGQ